MKTTIQPDLPDTVNRNAKALFGVMKGFFERDSGSSSDSEADSDSEPIFGYSKSRDDVPLDDSAGRLEVRLRRWDDCDLATEVIINGTSYPVC